jgi:hypothetical protein
MLVDDAVHRPAGPTDDVQLAQAGLEPVGGVDQFPVAGPQAHLRIAARAGISSLYG